MIIAIAVAIYVVTNKKPAAAAAKRWLLDDVVLPRAESGLVASRSFAKSVLEEHKRSIESIDIDAIAKRIPEVFGEKA